MHRIALTVAAALAGLGITTATDGASVQAAGAESAYSTIDLENGCLILTPPAEIEEMQGAEFVCPGHAGHVVWVGEGDLRFFLGYGPRGRDQCSYNQTLSAFNSIGTTLEWRLRDTVDGPQPFATILRYTVSMDGAESQYLVVTKLDGDVACHMAYVSAREPNHNALAREVADRYSDAFVCGQDEAFNFSSAGIDRNNRPGSGSGCPLE